MNIRLFYFFSKLNFNCAKMQFCTNKNFNLMLALPL